MAFSQGIKSLRTNTTGSNPSVADVVSNTVSVVQDLKSAQELQKQLASVSAKIASNLDLIDTEPKVALTRLINNFKELICSYIYTHDQDFSPMSEINSSKSAPSLDTDLDPDSLKNKVNQKYSLPAFPGNLFYLATGDNFSTHNPELYSRFETLRNNPQNKDVLNSELLVDLFPKYLIPGFSSLNSQLLQNYNNLIDLNKIKENPKVDLVDVFSVFGTKSVQSDNALKAFRKLDDYLKNVSYYAAANIVSLFQQQNIVADGDDVHYLLWMANVKLSIKTIPSIVEAIYMLFTDRPCGAEYGELWNNLLTFPNINSTTPMEILNIINFDTDLKKLYNSATQYFEQVGYSSLTQGLNNPIGSGALSNSVNSWKSQVSQVGGVLGSQAVFLIGCLVCFERLKVILENDETNETLIKEVAYGGYKLSNYLFNAEPVKKGFRAIGGLDV